MSYIRTVLFTLVLMGSVRESSVARAEPIGMPSSVPTGVPTDSLQTEVEYVASHWVSGVESALQFKIDYRELFERAIAESINPPVGRIKPGQILVQLVSLVSPSSRIGDLFARLLAATKTVRVVYKVTLVLEKYDYNTTNRTFELLTQDLQVVTDSGDLQQRLNQSIAVTFAGSVPGVTVSQFRASYSDMEINYLRTNWPTNMPTVEPHSGPRKQHSVAYTIGAIVIGGGLVLALTVFLDRRVRKFAAFANKISPTPGQAVSDLKSAKTVVRTAIPFLEVPVNVTSKVERFHARSFHEAGLLPFRFFYEMVRGLFDRKLWKHHRWMGSLVYLTYVPRYVRVFTVVSYAALMLLFSLFWIRDIQEDHLPKGFQLLNWDFIHKLILSMCACGWISSCVYTIVEGWYFTIIASYVRPVVPKGKGKRNGNRVEAGPQAGAAVGSPVGRRRAAAAPGPPGSTPHPTMDPFGGAVSETRQPVSSPPPVAGAGSPSRSRRISVRSATMGGARDGAAPSTPVLAAAVRRGSVSGPLNLVVSRRNNIRPRNNDDSAVSDGPTKGPTGFAPVPTRFTKFSVPVSRSGVHNVTRLQEEIMYCRGTLMAGEPPKSSNRQRDRRASSANSKAVNVKGLKRCHQFDRIWGLNKFGRISENRPTGTLSNTLYGRSRSSFQLLVSDLFSVHRAAGIELRKMQRPSMKLDPFFQEQAHLQRNRHRMVQLFQLDVLPPLDRAIVYNQIARHERLTEPVTLDRRVKIIGLVQICVCFLVTVFCVYWFQRPVSEKRQTSVVIVFLFWLGLDVLIVSTLSTCIKHVFLPHIATDEVHRVASWLLKTLDQLFGSISAGLGEEDEAAKGSSSAGMRQKELFKKMQSNIAGDINTSNMPSFVSLNAAHHFFLSSRIAGLFPISFPEVKAIYSFHTLWPKRNMDVLYDAEVEAKKTSASGKGAEAMRLNIVHVDGSSNDRSGAMKTEALTPPAQWMWFPKLLPYLLIYYFLKLPLRVQDMCVDMFSWGVTLGTIYLHAWLYFVNPYYMVIPIPAFFLLCSLCYMVGIFRDSKLVNHPRVSKDVGLWIMENKESDDPVGLETLYVHDALREQKKNNDDMMDTDDDGKPKSDFLAAMAAARDIDEDDDSDVEEGKKGLSAEEVEAARKERMMRNLEAEIASRAQARRGDPASSPHRQGNRVVLEALRPAPLLIKSP